MEVGTKVWIKNDQKGPVTTVWLPGEVQSKVVPHYFDIFFFNTENLDDFC
jgi:hypothetical protein